VPGKITVTAVGHRAKQEDPDNLLMNSPLNLTMNPKLDAALGEGWSAWEDAARDAGAQRATAWAAQRTGPDVPRQDLREHIEALLSAEDADDATFARAELAELLEEADDALADILWEGVLDRGFETDDSDLIFEATSHLAAIAEDHGDPLAAAEYFIDFLNWRRKPGSVSDPDAVQTAFDEVIRLAEADGQPKDAALYGYRQVAFTRLVDADADQAANGDWEADNSPYASWQ
jgi:hypothetical protein